MKPSIAALLGPWFWWPVRVRQRPAPQKFGDENTRQLSLFLDERVPADDLSASPDHLPF